MDIFIATVIAALACGYCAGWLHRGKRKRPVFQNGSALQKQPEPVWAKWAPEIGRAISGRRDA